MKSPSLSHEYPVLPVTLILNQPQFLRVVRSVLMDQGQFAVGRVRRRQTTQGLELIVDQWALVEGLPDGRSMAPMMDWAAMVCNFHNRIPVERLVEVVQPKRSHLLIAISLDPEHHELLPLLIQDEGRLFLPQQTRFIGAGLLILPEPNLNPVESAAPSRLKSPDSMTDSAYSTDAKSESGDLRSSRTAGALRSLYHRLLSMCVVIVGAGRGGQELARQLVAAGIRRLTIIDGDRIGPENLDAMPMTRVEDLGEFKAVLLARVLRLNQPDLTVTCIPHSILEPDAIRMLRGTRTDTVFSFIDGDAGRFAVSQLCRETQTLHVDTGSLIEWTDDGRTMSCDVRLFEPGLGCVACVPPMEDLDDVLYELSAPPGSLHRGPVRNWADDRAGSLLHLNALACALTIETWLAWLSGKIVTSHWRRVRWEDGGLPEIRGASVGPTDTCVYCQPESP